MALQSDNTDIHHPNTCVNSPLLFFVCGYTCSAVRSLSHLQVSAAVFSKLSTGKMKRQPTPTSPSTSPPVSSSPLCLHLPSLILLCPPFLTSSFIPLISPSCFDLQWFPSWLVAIETEAPRPPCSSSERFLPLV